MTPELVKLRNKLSVIFMQSPGAKAACVQMWFRAGSSLETPTEHGIAHFLEHMFFKGTAKYPGAKLTQALEESGAEVNAFTSYDYTCYYINTPNRDLLKNTAILLDMVAHPRFPAADFAPERQVVLEELHRSLDDPKAYAMFELRQNFLKPPYQHAILGSAKNIKNFSRATLLGFRKKHYNVQNAFLIVAGDFDQKKMSKLIASFSLPSGKAAQFQTFSFKKKYAPVALHFKDTPMGMLQIVQQGSPYGTPTAAAQELAWLCLSDGESSPLYQTLVREKNLANHVAGYTTYHQQGSCHYLRISFPWPNYAEVLQNVEAVFQQTLTKGFAAEDLAKALQQFKAQQIYRTETLENLAFDLGEIFALTQDLKAEENFHKLLEQCSLHDLDRALIALVDGLHFAVQIPQTAGEPSQDHPAARDEVLTAAQQQVEQLAQQLQTLRQNVLAKANVVFPQITPAKIKEDPNVRLYTLAPQMHYLSQRHSNAASFTLRFTFAGGQSMEDTAQSGITNLLSNTINKGHQGFTSAQIDQFLEAHCATLAATCTRNSFSIMLHGQSTHYEKLTSFLLDMLQTPAFPEKFTQQEKELALRQLAVQANDPVRLCMQKMNALMFLDHPYRENLLGNPASLAPLTSANLKKLWAFYFAQAPIIISHGGTADPQEEANFTRKLAQILGQRNVTWAINHQASSLTPLAAKAAEEFYFLDREQQHLLFAVPIAPYFAPENLALRILTTWLSGQSSKLFQKMRDELGLCYAVQPLHYSLLEGGFWGIYMACGLTRALEAKKAMQDFWQEVAEEGLTSKEFQLAKTMLQGQRDLDLQTEDDFASIYSFAILNQRPLNDFYLQNKILQKMTYQNFKQLIKQVLSRPLSIVRTGGQATK